RGARVLVRRAESLRRAGKRANPGADLRPPGGSRRGPRLLRLPVLYRLSTVAAGAHVLRLGGGDLDGPARSVPDRRAGLAARPVRLEPEAVAAGAASAVDAGA